MIGWLLPNLATVVMLATGDSSAVVSHHTSLDSVLVLPEVRVERERFATPEQRRAPTGWVSTLDVGASGRALETLPELLVGAPGVEVTQYGGLGAFATVSLRGAPSDQVAIYLDGMPLSGPARSVVDLSTLPLAAVDHAVLYSGDSPLSLGAAPGGAIDLITRRDQRGAEFRGSLGSFGSWDGAATAGVRRGALHALFHVSGSGSRGDFPYLDDNGTPFNATDDSVHARINAGYSLLGAMAGLEWAPHGSWRVRLRQHLVRKQQGVPGLGAVPAEDTHYGLTRSLTQFTFTHAGRALAPASELSGWSENEWSRFEDPLAQLGLGAHDTHDRLGDAGARVSMAWERLPLGARFDLASDLRRDDAHLDDARSIQPAPPDSRRDAAGAAVGVGWRGFDDRFELRAARRWDRLWDDLSADAVTGLETSTVTRTLDAPQLGARARLGLGFEARANWSRAARAPDFLELFGNSGSVLGNPALTPETAENRDAGLTWNTPAATPLRADLRWSVFDSRLEDLILYVRNSASSVKAQNISLARIQGHEASAHVVAPLGLSAELSFTTQRAVDEGPVSYWHGKRLPEHPAQQGQLRLEWRGRGWRAGSSLDWLGDDYLDRYNRYRVAARRLFGATLGVPLFATRATLALEGKNLTDDRTADVAGFPLPGRSFFVALETRLGPAPAPEPR